MNETVVTVTPNVKAFVQVPMLTIAKNVLTLKMENIALLNVHLQSTQKMEFVSIVMNHVCDAKDLETQSLMMGALSVIMPLFIQMEAS